MPCEELKKVKEIFEKFGDGKGELKKKVLAEKLGEVFADSDKRDKIMNEVVPCLLKDPEELITYEHFEKCCQEKQGKGQGCS